MRNIKITKSKNDESDIKGNMYNHTYKNSSMAFYVNRFEFQKEMESNRLMLSTVYQFSDGDNDFMGIFKEIQIHPITSDVTHIDVLSLEENKEIAMVIRINFINEDICKGLKDGGSLKKHRQKLNVSFLPKNAINQVTVDISKLEIGSAISVEDLNLSNVKISETGSIVSVAAPRVFRR